MRILLSRLYCDMDALPYFGISLSFIVDSLLRSYDQNTHYSYWIRQAGTRYYLHWFIRSVPKEGIVQAPLAFYRNNNRVRNFIYWQFDDDGRKQLIYDAQPSDFANNTASAAGWTFLSVNPFYFFGFNPKMTIYSYDNFQESMLAFVPTCAF